MLKFILWGGIWIGFILHWVFGSIKRKKYFEIYAGCGIGICLTLLVYHLFGPHIKSDIYLFKILHYIGSFFYIVAIIVALVTLFTLKYKGHPKAGIENTTVFIKHGIFKIIRHPLYLALTIWVLALILIIHSMYSTILGIIAVFCFWKSGKKEDEYNLKKFGDSYTEYMNKIPMWNIFKVLSNRFKK